MHIDDHQLWEYLTLPAILWRAIFFLSSLLLLLYIGVNSPM